MAIIRNYQLVKPEYNSRGDTERVSLMSKHFGQLVYLVALNVHLGSTIITANLGLICTTCASFYCLFVKFLKLYFNPDPSYYIEWFHFVPPLPVPARSGAPGG